MYDFQGFAPKIAWRTRRQSTFGLRGKNTGTGSRFQKLEAK